MERRRRVGDNRGMTSDHSDLTITVAGDATSPDASLPVLNEGAAPLGHDAQVVVVAGQVGKRHQRGDRHGCPMGRQGLYRAATSVEIRDHLAVSRHAWGLDLLVMRRLVERRDNRRVHRAHPEPSPESQWFVSRTKIVRGTH